MAKGDLVKMEKNESLEPDSEGKNVLENVLENFLEIFLEICYTRKMKKSW